MRIQACFGLLLLLAHCASETLDISIQNLRCEYLKDPVALSIERPRLSWELYSEARQKTQTAYRIMVASDTFQLLLDQPDLWDSEKINSSKTNQIQYGGALPKAQGVCFWKVKIWDESGKESAWSPIARWSPGLSDGDWKAEWIGPRPEHVPKDNQYYVHRGFHSATASRPDEEKWILIDLGAEQQFDEIRLYPTHPVKPSVHAYLFPLRFEVDISSDPAFSSSEIVAAQKEHDYHPKGIDPYIKNFEPRTARYVRVKVTKLAPVNAEQYAFSLAEIEIRQKGVNVVLGKSVKTSDYLMEENWAGINWKKERLVDGFVKANENHPYYSLKVPPSPLLRKEFQINKKIEKAVLYMTSLGLYDAHINGLRIDNQVLAPEWTDYHTRVQYQGYDVTDLLTTGDNAIGVTLADGWYAGAVFSHPERGSYDFDRKLLAQLEIQFDDGSTDRIVTDGSWRVFENGPIQEASLYNGEVYDASLEQQNWDRPGFNDDQWSPVVVSESSIERDAQMNEPIRVVRELKPVRIFQPEKGKYVFDMGQNMVGWCKLFLPYNPHAPLTLRHGEVLNDDSTLYVDNLRSAKQRDVYMPGKEDSILYAPRFTYHGFRFVEVTGLSSPPDLNTITGQVVASGSPQVGTFECSSKEVNQLWSNIFWTQLGNMHAVPTDCPQRDERAGWMGDAQVFSQNAIYNMDMAGFFTKWVRDIRDTQGEDGQFPDFAPQVGHWTAFYNSPGWADAGVIVPWRVYENYADTSILSQQFEAMKKFIDFVQRSNSDLLWRKATGNMYGDWLNGNTIVSDDYPKEGGSIPNDVYSTAFFAYSTRIVSNTARLLGKEKDFKQYDSLATAIKEKFISTFVDPEGVIKGNTQAGYALALDFDLLPEGLRAKAATHMVKAIEAYDYRISTGIQTTIRLMNQLSAFGYDDVAYKLLESKRFPSWLYSVDQGATTIWERWDGYVKGRGFQDKGMNSFNHYAIGAVGEWMYRTILGIQPDREHPGYQHFTIHPVPGGSITWANGSYHSIAGMITVAWKKNAHEFTMDVRIPANTTATIYMPFSGDVTESNHTLEEAEGIDVLRMDDGKSVLHAGSGRYSFHISMK